MLCSFLSPFLHFPFSALRLYKKCLSQQKTVQEGMLVLNLLTYAVCPLHTVGYVLATEDLPLS